MIFLYSAIFVQLLIGAIIGIIILFSKLTLIETNIILYVIFSLVLTTVIAASVKREYINE